MIISHRIINGHQQIFFFTYPTHSHLHDGIKASLWRVKVSRDVLLAHQSIKLLAITGQLQDVLVAERACAVLVTCAWVQQLGWGGANVWHHCLFHKGTKSFQRQVGFRM